MEILGVDTDRDSLEKTLLGDSMMASERENKKRLHRQYLTALSTAITIEIFYSKQN